MFYAYTAISPQGHRVKGLIYSTHRQQVRDILLKSDQLQLLSARRAWGIFLLRFFQKAPWDWLQNFFFQMSCLLRAGIPVPDALKSLKEMEASRYRRWVIGDLLHKIERGKRLSDVLEGRKQDFPSLVSPMIRVGEVSGNLGKAFEDLSTYAGWRQTNQQKLRQTIRYPLFVLCLVVCLIFFLMTSVAPVNSHAKLSH
ncbi:MAG: hypothetical protein GY915_03485 [bacterium]|nr:hypothetical protein [bacterium]